MSKPDKRVVITGIGPVASIGTGKNEFWSNLAGGKSNVKEESVDIDGALWDKFLCHRVENFDISNFGIEPASLEWIKDWKQGDETIDLLYMIAAIKLAMDDAGLRYDPWQESEMGLVITHENINLTPFISKFSENAYRLMKEDGAASKKEFYEKLYRSTFKSGYDTQPFMALFHLTKVFNVHKHSLFICNACASGLYAMETASQLIKSGKNDVVAVAASDQADIYKYLWFRDIGIYSKDGIIRPFAEDCNGFIFGDAGISIILEEYEHARRRNATIYAEYAGGGFSLESWQVTMPAVGSDYYLKAIQSALRESNMEAADIDMICPHGVGSYVTDSYEAKAINDAFAAPPPITAFKPYVGHTLGASALLESAIALLCMSKGIILPTLNTTKENPKHNLRIVKTAVQAKLHSVLKSCSAFAGFNAAVVLKRCDE